METWDQYGLTFLWKQLDSAIASIREISGQNLHADVVAAVFDRFSGHLLDGSDNPSKEVGNWAANAASRL